jgi:hypothetical protein
MAIKQKKEVNGNLASGNVVVPVVAKPILDVELEDEVEMLDDVAEDLLDDDIMIPVAPLSLRIGKSLLRKLTEYAQEEGVSREELAAELISEGIVLRAWEIVEKKATMRGGNAHSNNNFNRNGNAAPGNQGNSVAGHTQGHQQRFQHQQGGNKMAQRKLQRQARQHANSMDLMSDKAAFLEYVRNQEKKRR